MRKVAAAMALTVFACGQSMPAVQYRGISESKRVEERKLPARPDDKPIPERHDWIRVMASKSCTDRAGILFSAEKAARAKLWQMGYIDLRDLYELDREIWVQQRIVYEERLGQANTEIRRLSPTWWDSNKGTIGWASGFVLGVVATIAVVYGVEEARE